MLTDHLDGWASRGGQDHSVWKVGTFFEETDVYRPAAIEQLVKLGERIKVPVFEQGTDAQPADIAAAGLKHVSIA